MRFKMAQSEVDGLFMKANRKHQIMLGFELKRIAVEKKMRERYFAFEKSLVVAHQDKIIARQKALGIFRPKTTPDKKLHNFFVTNVAMEKKRRTRLPPVGKANAIKNKEADTVSRMSNDSPRNAAVQRASLPSLTPNWSLTEVDNMDDGLLIEHIEKANKTEGSKEEKTIDNNNISTEANLDEKDMEKLREISTKVKSSNKTLENRSDSGKNDQKTSFNGEFSTNKIERHNLEKNKDNEETKLPNVRRDSEKLSELENIAKNETHTNPEQYQDTDTKNSALYENEQSNFDEEASLQEHSTQKNLDKKEDNLKGERPKSVNSGTVEGIRSELMNLSMRAQSAGVKAAK